MKDVKFYSRVWYSCILFLLLSATLGNAREGYNSYWDRSREIDSLFNAKSFVECRQLSQQLLRQSKQQKRFKRVAECWYNIGRSFRSENIDSASVYYFKALSVAEGLQDDSVKFFTLVDLAILNKGRSYFRLASDYFYQALKTTTCAESNFLKFNVFISLGNIHRELGQPEKTLQYLRNAEGYFRESNEPGKLAECMNSIGKAMISMEAYDSALVKLNESLKIYESLKSKHAPVVYFNIADAYYYKGDLEEAKRVWEMILRKAQGRDQVVYTWGKLANLYLDLEEAESASRYISLLEQENASSSSNTIYLLKDEHELKFRLAYLLGNFEKALAEKEAAYYWQQESLNADVKKSIAEWETKFQFDQMRGSLAKQRFEIERSTLQNDLLKQQNAIFAISAIIFLFAVVFAIIWGFRERKFKQVKERMLREFNHRVRNNLNALSGLFRLQLKKMDHGVARVSVLEGKSRLETLNLLYNQLDPQNQKSFTVRFDLYLQELVMNAVQTLDVEQVFDVSQNMDEFLMQADRATNYGLIVNEVVTNACKYGATHSNPKLNVQLRDGWLTIHDNGKGLPDNYRRTNGKTMGFQLIKELASQLEANHEFLNMDGLSFKIELK